MNKTLIWKVSALILLSGGAWLYGQVPPSSSITLKQPQPEVLVVNTPTTVTIPAIITGDVIPGSVNLLRVGTNGQSTVLGQMIPDASVGVNGYSIPRSFTETALGTVNLQISVAIKGQLRRATSQPFLLAVSTKSITLPPDPGEAGMGTLAGIDSDQDGVRDDVQRYIVFSYPNSEKDRLALHDTAKAVQQLLTTTDAVTAGTAKLNIFVATQCLAGIIADAKARSSMESQLDAVQLNTESRFLAWTIAEDLAGAHIYTAPASRKSSCTFDPDKVEN